ncbi:MAG: carbohydate-binding domain-containing protein, partial [Aeromonas sobria]
MTSETRFDANQTSSLLPAKQIDDRILPSPQKQVVKAGPQVDFSTIKLNALDLPSDRAEVIKAELTKLGVTLSDTGYPVTIKLGSKVKQAEGYDMTIGQKGTVIQGKDIEGAFWGAQSLISLLGVDDKLVSQMTVEDAPRFEYRGMQTDVARHFRSPETLHKLIDQMSAMKLNKLHLTKTGADVESKDWSIYISSIRRIQRVDNDQFTITPMTGDLYRLTPTDKFQGFAKDATVEVPLVVEYWVLFESDIMPNWYVASEGAEPKVLASMSNINDASTYQKPMPADGWKRTKDDKNILMNSETRFAANQTSALLPAGKIDNQILPTPLKQVVKAGPQVDFSTIKLNALDLPSDRAEVLKAELTKLGVTLS